MQSSSPSCKHGGPPGSCSLCYDEVILAIERENKQNQAIPKSRKTITRINLTEYKAQVVIYTNENSGMLQHWANDNEHVVKNWQEKAYHCYLSRSDALELPFDKYDKKKLATIHTCKDHMVVVDWTA